MLESWGSSRGNVRRWRHVTSVLLLAYKFLLKQHVSHSSLPKTQTQNRFRLTSRQLCEDNCIHKALSSAIQSLRVCRLFLVSRTTACALPRTPARKPQPKELPLLLESFMQPRLPNLSAWLLDHEQGNHQPSLS